MLEHVMALLRRFLHRGTPALAFGDLFCDTRRLLAEELQKPRGHARPITEATCNKRRASSPRRLMRAASRDRTASGTGRSSSESRQAATHLPAPRGRTGTLGFSRIALARGSVDRPPGRSVRRMARLSAGESGGSVQLREIGLPDPRRAVVRSIGREQENRALGRSPRDSLGISRRFPHPLRIVHRDDQRLSLALLDGQPGGVYRRLAS